MKNRTRLKILRSLGLLAAAILLSGSPASTARAAIILFDPDGGGADAPVFIGGFTFSAGNTLSLNSVPLPPAGSSTLIPTLFQASVNGFTDTFGDPFSVNGLNSTFELTVVMRFNEVVTSSTGFPGAVTFAVAADQTGSYVEMYFGPKNASALNGTGYNDGQLIMQGTPSSALLNNGNFSLGTAGGVPIVGNLDQFGGDNYPAIDTVAGTGSALIGSNVELQNSSFFLTHLFTFSINGNLKLPYQETNPSALFDANRNLTGLGTPGPAPTQPGATVASVGTRNGDPVLGGPNFIFQNISDASVTAVPEPSTVALALSGLVALVGLGLRRKSVSA